MSVTTLQIAFEPCSPEPANGYNILYRVLGSGDPYTDAGNFSSSPAVISVDYPNGTEFEGTIRGDCGDGNFGPAVPWSTGGGIEAICRNYEVENNGAEGAVFVYISCLGVTTPVFLLAGQSVTVCAMEDQVFVSESFTVTPGEICPTCESCGQYQATGEATEGTAFSYRDCEGVLHGVFIANDEEFLFCTCDDDPQYSTENVTVVRVGDCP